MQRRVLGYVVVNLKFEQEGNKWVGTCVELGTSTYSRSLKRTQEDLGTLVLEHLDLLEGVGERERFFKEWGIEFHKVKPKTHNFRVPVMEPWGLRQTSVPGPLFQPGVFPVRPAREPVAAGN